MQDQVNTIHRDIKTARKCRKESLKIKNSVKGTNNAFDGLISGLDLDNEKNKIVVLEYMSLQFS